MMAESSMQQTPLAAALEYAARGWRVFPVHSVTADGRCTCGVYPCGTDNKGAGTGRSCQTSGRV